MFCVIQKVKNKTPNENGVKKELLVDSYSISADGVIRTKYYHKYSEERFERPILDAYKISIHHSYRENRKVKKKQWSICTMDYYDLLEFGPYDCVEMTELREKIAEMGITEEKLWEMVYAKLDPIIEAVKKEFETTEEFRAKRKQKSILLEYNLSKTSFELKYGLDTYDCCYDVFGELRNPEYLEQLEEQYKAQQEYKERSYSNSQQSNYNYYNFGSYQSRKQSSYNNDDKTKLKKIFKTLSKTYHPDITGDDGEMMKFINRLKGEWGI